MRSSSREQRLTGAATAPATVGRPPRFAATGPSLLLGLQRSVGNAAAARLLAVQRAGEGPCKVDGDELELQRAPAPAPPVKLPTGSAWQPAKHVVPAYVVARPAATRSNTAPSTTKTDDPTFTGGPAVDATGKVWRYQIASVSCTGTIQLVYYDDVHYPAPTPDDDTGALTNTTSVNWKDTVKDLKDNRNGVPAFWSAYRRETLHENYHWEVEWKGKVNLHVGKAEKRIAALKVDFATAPAEADADAVLKPLASAIFSDEMSKARAEYNALGDSPGDPPYRAQAPALDAMRARVSAHAKAQKWP